jgi:hypothetical protein
MGQSLVTALEAGDVRGFLPGQFGDALRHSLISFSLWRKGERLTRRQRPEAPSHSPASR